MIIRLVEEEDLDGCGCVYAEAFDAAPYNGSWTQQTASDMLSGLLRRDPAHCWCMEENGSILGFAFCTTFGTFRGTIQELAIAPGLQGRGLGTQLMQHILGEFRKEGVQNVDLIANLDAPAYGFYKKFGFKRPRRYTVMARSI